MSGATINTLGLILDIVGALLIWFFVVEPRLIDEADYLKGHATLKVHDPTPDEVRSYKLRGVISRVGASLLVAGFVLQVVSNYVP